MPKNQTYKDKQEQAQALERENNARLDRFATYQGQRCKAHNANMPSPIIKNKDGTLQWLNRAQRRKNRK